MEDKFPTEKDAEHFCPVIQGMCRVPTDSDLHSFLERCRNKKNELSNAIFSISRKTGKLYNPDIEDKDWAPQGCIVYDFAFHEGIWILFGISRRIGGSVNGR